MESNNIPVLRSSAFKSVFAFLLVFMGCQSIPVDIAAPKPTATISGSKTNAEKGREIYVSLLRCAMCHRPKPVYDYNPDAWEHDILPKMAKKARLKSDEYTAVLAYVTSAEAQKRPHDYP